MRTAARRLKPVRWVAEVAGKGAKSQSRFSSLPEVGRRASLQVTIATLTVGVVSMEGRQSVALELHSIRLELHTELAAQSLRKIPHVASSSASKLTTTGPQKPVLLPRFDVEFTANSIATAHTSR